VGMVTGFFRGEKIVYCFNIRDEGNFIGTVADIACWSRSLWLRWLDIRMKMTPKNLGQIAVLLLLLTYIIINCRGNGSYPFAKIFTIKCSKSKF